jgi:elongation factor G
MKHTHTGDTVTVRKSLGKKSPVEVPKSAGGDLVLQGVPSSPAVFSVAIEAESPSHQRDLDAALLRLLSEDPSLRLSTDVRSGETLLSGMGQLHLEIVVDRLTRILPHSIHISEPRVAYRETLTNTVTIEEHYDKTIGSTRLRASLKLTLGPIAEVEETFCGVDDSAGSSASLENNQILLPADISANPELAHFIRSGVMSALGRGPLLGSPTSHIRAVVTSLADEVNASSSAAISACASSAVSQALASAQSCLLEPVMRVECIVPESCMGDVIADLTNPGLRRGIVNSVERDNLTNNVTADSLVRIHARVPLQGMVDWSTRMRSITKGRGDFSMDFASYEVVASSQQACIMGALRRSP